MLQKIFSDQNRSSSTQRSKQTCIFMAAMSTMLQNWEEPTASLGLRTLSTFSSYLTQLWCVMGIGQYWMAMIHSIAKKGKKEKRNKKNSSIRPNQLDLAGFLFSVNLKVWKGANLEVTYHGMIWEAERLRNTCSCCDWKIKVSAPSLFSEIKQHLHHYTAQHKHRKCFLIKSTSTWNIVHIQS